MTNCSRMNTGLITCRVKCRTVLVTVMDYLAEIKLAHLVQLIAKEKLEYEQQTCTACV